MLGQPWKTYLVVALIIGLVVGAGVGWVAKPIPPPGPEWVLKTELDKVKADLAASKAELDKVKADVAKLTGDYNKLKADYDALLKAGLTGEIVIGAILSLTGDLATFGENEKVAAEFAAKQINEFLKASGAKWTLKIISEDTQTKPDICLAKVESLAAKGIKFLLGPLSSAEVRAIKGYCDANKILAISQSSTAPDLAIPGDYIFRFCPTDAAPGGQGVAIARILCDDNKTYVIPVTRNDAWGVGLEEAAATRFKQLGGTVLEGIRYAPEAAEFTAEAKNLADKVTRAIASYGADKVAVLHISFEEVNAFFTAARKYDILWKVKWYGTDGTFGSGAMLEDPAVREFAMAVKYPCTMFAPTHSPKWEMVRQNGKAVLGREPESYSYTAYDIVWAYAMSLLTVNKYDPTAVKAVLPTVTRLLFGASGWVDLDEAGDRKQGDYDIWQIAEISPGKYDWKPIGIWVTLTDSVTRL